MIPIPSAAILFDYAKYAVLAIVIAAVAAVTHKLDSAHYKNALSEKLGQQKTALEAACKQDKAISTEVSQGYEKALSDLRGQLANAKRMQPAHCVAIRPTASAASGYNAAASAGKYDNKNAGVNSDSLIDFAGEAEGYRQQVIALQNFITQTWRTKGQ